MTASDDDRCVRKSCSKVGESSRAKGMATMEAERSARKPFVDNDVDSTSNVSSIKCRP